MTGRRLAPSPPRGAKFSRLCRCGCGQWAKWIGLEDNVALMVGCDLMARRWLRTPADPWPPT